MRNWAEKLVLGCVLFRKKVSVNWVIRAEIAVWILPLDRWVTFLPLTVVLAQMSFIRMENSVLLYCVISFLFCKRINFDVSTMELSLKKKWAEKVLSPALSQPYHYKALLRRRRRMADRHLHCARTAISMPSMQICFGKRKGSHRNGFWMSPNRQPLLDDEQATEAANLWITAAAVWRCTLDQGQEAV